MSDRTNDGVSLPAGQTGSSFFHGVLKETTEAFGDVFREVRLPADTKGFKRDYAELLVRFEAARTRSPERAAIARFLAKRTHEQLMFAGGRKEVPLSAHLAGPVALPRLTRTTMPGLPGLRAEVPFEGRVYRDRAVIGLAEELRHRHHLTERALDSLRWIVRHIEDQGGALDLTGQRFAVLGAGAELAPTASLLRAGADVLWIDVADPDETLARRAPRESLSGHVYTAADTGDLLAQPKEIAAALRTFAADGPIHLGLFAYAPGKGRELRLAAAMDAVARSLEPGLLRSLACYISPTTPARVQPEDRDGAATRFEKQPIWKSALNRLGALPAPGHHVVADAAVARSVVSLQGPGYLAAQYLTKIATAEAWATHGRSLDGAAAAPLTVSANVAGITNTRSLQHPLFQAAFLGAPNFQIQIFKPETTRALSALLMLRDVLDPDAPNAAAATHDSAAAKGAAVLAQQVHGGVYSMPWQLEPLIRVAAVLGLAKRPSLLWRR